ncbi:MAG: ABC transporter permease [Clostridia bacterium]|nr:ABC transporter permease [Clostridia bacterium]
MRAYTFSIRTAKEILRDPLTLFFGIGFPLVLLFLLSAIQANIPVSLFEIANLTPGIVVFGLSFISLFSATLISKDRSSSLLQRLYTTPMKARDFLAGYILPLIPISVMQSAVCFVAAIALNLPISINILYSLLLIVPISLFYISIGLLCGSLLNDKQVGGICGALLTNLSAWLSGTWFDLELVGGTFKKIAYALPFVHAVEMEKCALSGSYEGFFGHFAYVAVYTLAMLIIAILVFTRKMKQN